MTADEMIRRSTATRNLDSTRIFLKVRHVKLQSIFLPDESVLIFVSRGPIHIILKYEIARDYLKDLGRSKPRPLSEQ